MNLKSQLKLGNWRIVVVVGCSALALSGVSFAGEEPQPATSSSDTSNASQPLPDSASELSGLKAQVDRQLAASDAEAAAWKMVVASLSAAKESVESTPTPDTAALEKLASGHVTSGNINSVKAQLQAGVSSIQFLFSRAAPNMFANNSGTSTEPDVAVFMAQWQGKITEMQGAINLQPFYPVLFSTTATPHPEDVAPLLAQIKDKLSAQAFTQDKAGILGALTSLLQQATQSENKAEEQETSLQKEDDDIVAKQSKTKTEINQLAIELGLPLFCATVLLMLALPIVVQAVTKAPTSDIHDIFTSGILVEIITVLLLTMSILILGLSGKIEGPVLGTLLGGISGYVLNRFRGKGQDANNGATGSDGQGSAPRADSGKVNDRDRVPPPPPVENSVPPPPPANPR